MAMASLFISSSPSFTLPYYLHTGPDGGIFHRDVKSTNILLDEHYVAKVADFGLSQQGMPDPDHISMGFKGTFGYLDPEYFRTFQLTNKSDVYAFGVVLLEVLCARPPVVDSQLKEEINLAEWGMFWQKEGQLEKIIDPLLAGHINPNSLRKFGEIVEKCLKPQGADRPNMHDVCWDLEYAMQLQQTAVHREAHEDTTITGVSSDSALPVMQNMSRMLGGEYLNSKKSNRTMLLLYCSSLVSSSSILISLIAHSSHLKHIHQTHAFMLLRALDTDNLLLSRFIHACSSLGFYSYAYSLFTSITHAPDIYLYNNIIKALSSSPTHPKASIFLYNNIQLAGLRPDSYSFPFALKAVTRFSSIQTGRQLHSQSIRFGLHSNLHVLTAFVQMYSSFGSGCICDARKMFDGMSMSTGDVALWNAMLNGYAKLGDLCNARDLFERMPQRNVISWTALITGYAQANRPHDAIALFRRMQLENVEPDEIAMLVALTACARLGALELGEWIRHYIDRLGLLTTNIPLNNALIDMYAKSGDIKRALQVFENMNHKTIITWTTMIAGLALHGLGTEALEMFSRMERARVKPNDITFIAILSACSHVGLVQTGRWYFNRMVSRYGIEPKIEHYGCMIDLLGRAGHLKEARTLLAQMPFEPNAVIWGSLLAACNTHGDPELGELALQHLLELEPDNSGNYALLSNIYASRGRWNESRVVRKVMWDAGVKKIPGGSLIEVNNRVHEFIAGETSHSQFDRIQEVLSKINRQLGLSQHFEKESGALLELG